MSVLVTGGAGYIGSHIVKELGKRGLSPLIVDNLSTGHKEAILAGTLFHQDLSEIEKLEKIFQEHSIEHVIHMAGFIVVPDSIERPLDYYQNNTVLTLKLLQLCVKYKVKSFIFSSTAAVYAPDPDGKPLDENAKVDPMTPYGRSKLMSEQIIQDAAKAYGISYIILRYFNVAGADPEGEIGQSFPGATHLIKVTCETALGKRKHVDQYGSDYPTKDGSGVRDFIHVTDLARAHVKALDYLMAGGKSQIINCGNGRGYSVKEVFKAVEKISGRDLNINILPRRNGDIGQVIAKAEKIGSLLSWAPEYEDLEYIVRTAYLWEKSPRY